jgi:hypothetical protein
LGLAELRRGELPTDVHRPRVSLSAYIGVLAASGPPTKTSRSRGWRAARSERPRRFGSGRTGRSGVAATGRDPSMARPLPRRAPRRRAASIASLGWSPARAMIDQRSAWPTRFEFLRPLASVGDDPLAEGIDGASIIIAEDHLGGDADRQREAERLTLEIGRDATNGSSFPPSIPERLASRRAGKLDCLRTTRFVSL